MSEMKIHPLRTAREGDVLAVKFGPNQWGIVRVLRGSALGIWDRWTTRPTIPPLLEGERPEKWFYYFLRPKRDETEMVSLGAMPFTLEEHAEHPPCFDPPNIFRNNYQIYYRGFFRDASADDVADIHPCERVDPSKLVTKIQNLYSRNLLRLITT